MEMENWKIKSFPNIFKIFDKMWENDSSSGGFYIAASMEYNRIVMITRQPCTSTTRRYAGV